MEFILLENLLLIVCSYDFLLGYRKTHPCPSLEGTAVRIEVVYLIYVKYKFFIFYINAIKTSILKISNNHKIHLKKPNIIKRDVKLPSREGAGVCLHKKSNLCNEIFCVISKNRYNNHLCKLFIIKTDIRKYKVKSLVIFINNCL